MTGDREGVVALFKARILAEKFHEFYEVLAPGFGYETREETRKFDPFSPNGRLMIATCRALLNDGIIIFDENYTEEQDARGVTGALRKA